MAELGEAQSSFPDHGSRDVPACESDGPEKTDRKIRSSTDASTSAGSAQPGLDAPAGPGRRRRQQSCQKHNVEKFKSKSPAKIETASSCSLGHTSICVL